MLWSSKFVISDSQPRLHRFVINKGFVVRELNNRLTVFRNDCSHYRDSDQNKVISLQKNPYFFYQLIKAGLSVNQEILSPSIWALKYSIRAPSRLWLQRAYDVIHSHPDRIEDIQWWLLVEATSLWAIWILRSVNEEAYPPAKRGVNLYRAIITSYRREIVIPSHYASFPSQVILPFWLIVCDHSNIGEVIGWRVCRFNYRLFSSFCLKLEDKLSVFHFCCWQSNGTSLIIDQYSLSEVWMTIDNLRNRSRSTTRSVLRLIRCRRSIRLFWSIVVISSIPWRGWCLFFFCWFVVMAWMLIFCFLW